MEAIEKVISWNPRKKKFIVTYKGKKGIQEQYSEPPENIDDYVWKCSKSAHLDAEGSKESEDNSESKESQGSPEGVDSEDTEADGAEAEGDDPEDSSGGVFGSIFGRS